MKNLNNLAFNNQFYRNNFLTGAKSRWLKRLLKFELFFKFFYSMFLLKIESIILKTGIRPRVKVVYIFSIDIIVQSPRCQSDLYAPFFKWHEFIAPCVWSSLEFGSGLRLACTEGLIVFNPSVSNMVQTGLKKRIDSSNLESAIQDVENTVVAW